MNNLYLLAKIDGVDVAISSDSVDSVIKVSDPVPAPATPQVVAGLFALRSRVLTLIDCQFLITGEQQEVRHNHLAIVVKISGFHYGLLVDDVSDVRVLGVEETEIHGKLGAGWNRITSGMIELEDRTLLLVEPEVMIEDRSRHAA